MNFHGRRARGAGALGVIRALAATGLFLGALVPALRFLAGARVVEERVAGAQARGAVRWSESPPSTTGAVLAVDPTVEGEEPSTFSIRGPRRVKTTTSPGVVVRRRTPQHLVLLLSGGWGDGCTGPMNSVRVEFWAEPAQASAWSIFNTCLGGINGESLSDDPLMDGSPLQGHVLVSKLDDGLPKVGATVQMRLKKAAVFRGDATDYEADFLIPK